MEPLSKFILKMQHFASRNTALGQFSCRLDSAGGGEYLGQERFSRNHLGVRTAFVSQGLRIMVITDDRWLYIELCPRVIPGPVYLYPRVEPIDIELRSFSFYPNHIAIIRDQSSFTFRLKNTAQVIHKFTLVDNQKNILVNVDLMPDESTIVTIEALEPGNYTFYCNRHRHGGMEGMFMVGG
jgi:hypothetical protein